MSIKLVTERASTYAWTLQRHEATTRPTYKLAASGASGGSLVPGELFIEDFTVLQLLLGPKLYYDAPCRLNLDGILLVLSPGFPAPRWDPRVTTPWDLRQPFLWRASAIKLSVPAYAPCLCFIPDIYGDVVGDR